MKSISRSVSRNLDHRSSTRSRWVALALGYVDMLYVESSMYVVLVLVSGELCYGYGYVSVES